jgi:uncharacterized DUF497 family protein
LPDNLDVLDGFDWDNGNISKNWNSHKVSIGECEEVFFNNPFFIFDDEKHSTDEKRYYILGETNIGRTLFIVFTIRNSKVRIISSGDMHKKERYEYEKLKKSNP